MADGAKQDAPGAESAEAPETAGGGSTINSQVIDAIAAINTLTEGLAPSTSMAMLDVIGADSIALAMLNAVARQQADATIGSAALAAICARLAGTCLPDGAGAASPAEFVIAAEAQAWAAVVNLKSQAEQEGDAAEPAKAALARIAAAAAPAPQAKGTKAGKSGGAAS